jgi:acetyltransferase-like isoleucine patch superfamily enzyme
MRSVVIYLLALIWKLSDKGKTKLELASGVRYPLYYTRSRGDNLLRIGEGSIVSARIDFDRANACVEIGKRCFVGASHIVCAELVLLEDDVVISWGVTITDHNSHAVDWEDRKSDIVDWGKGNKNWTSVKIAPVRIKERAWIGFNATILKGVTIGKEAVIAAGAVVTKDVPDYAVAAGNPARVVRLLKHV